jgi:hypothetical protein
LDLHVVSTISFFIIRRETTAIIILLEEGSRMNKKRMRYRTYGVTLIPGTLFIMKSAATKAFDSPTSDSLSYQLLTVSKSSAYLKRN